MRDADAFRLCPQEKDFGVTIERVVLAPHLDDGGKLFGREWALDLPAGFGGAPLDERLLAERRFPDDLHQFRRVNARDNIPWLQSAIASDHRRPPVMRDVVAIQIGLDIVRPQTPRRSRFGRQNPVGLHWPVLAG